MNILVCEEVCNEGNLFDDGRTIVANVDYDELKELAKNSDIVSELEYRIKQWTKKLSEVLKESEQIRRENDSSGRN